MDTQSAALEKPGLCYIDIFEAPGAFWHRCFATIEAIDETTTKLRHFDKGVGLTTLVYNI